MRTLFVRGALIAFFAVTGLIGSAATVQFNGMSADMQTHSASAAMRPDPSCIVVVHFPERGGPPFYVCRHM